MSAGAVLFMLVSWLFVLGLMSWSFRRILRHRRHHDPDGMGTASPQESGLYDPESRAS
ncbi:MAG TPA: hypothetical protein VFZ69_06535 [Longimicrobiales bacterium]